MPVRGDFDQLRELRERIASLGVHHGRDAGGRFVKGGAGGMIRVCAEAAVKQLDDEFRKSVDPYGQPWAPLRSRDGVPLRDKGLLLNSLAPTVTATGFVISTKRPGAEVHQYGATIKPKNAKALRFQIRGRWVMRKSVTIPRRQYIPEGELGNWGPAIDAAADDYVRTVMGAT